MECEKLVTPVINYYFYTLNIYIKSPPPKKTPHTQKSKTKSRLYFQDCKQLCKEKQGYLVSTDFFSCLEHMFEK